MSEEEIQRVFDPFFSSPDQKDKNPTGIGMGLTICKQICESLGGDITVTSKPKFGSKFTFSMKVFKIETFDSGSEATDQEE